MTRTKILTLLQFHGIPIPTLDKPLTSEQINTLKEIRKLILLGGARHICHYLMNKPEHEELHTLIRNSLHKNNVFTLTGYFTTQLHKVNKTLPLDKLTLLNLRIIWIDHLCGIQ